MLQTQCPRSAFLIAASVIVFAIAMIASAATAQPTLIETGWQLIRTDVLLDPQSARLNPKDGHLYALRIRQVVDGGGLYRIEATAPHTLIAAGARPRGILIDPDDGDIFHSEADAGRIYRTAFGTTGRTNWVVDFGGPGDDDPLGMSLAPDGHTGSIVAPGQALVADEGFGGPKEVWNWSVDTSGGETRVQPDTGVLLKPVDVAIGLSEVYLCDQDADGIFQPGVGALFRMNFGGTLTQLTPSVAIDDPRGVAVDPITQDLLVMDQESDRLLRVNPVSGTTTEILTGLTLIPQSETAGIEATADGLWLVVTDRGADEIYTYARVPASVSAAPCGDTLAGDITTLGEIDFFEFNALANDVVGLTSAPVGASFATPRVVLLAPDGSRIDLSGEFSGCQGRCVSAGLPADGTYTVAVFDHDHDGTGAYDLTLESLSGSLGGAVNGGNDLICGQGADGAREILCGATLTGTFDAEADTDAYTFSGEAGDAWQITTAAAGGSGVAPEILLTAPGGASVDLNASSAPCAGVCGSAALPASGTYTISVADATLIAFGDYDITAQELSSCSSACSDGIDNDGDTFVDGADAGCATSDDFSEESPCADAVDNDGDGLVDFGSDLGCVSAIGAEEDPACDDGVDNDSDGGIDWDGGGFGTADTFCTSNPSRNREKPKGCGLGFELLFLLAPLLVAHRIRRSP